MGDVSKHHEPFDWSTCVWRVNVTNIKRIGNKSAKFPGLFPHITLAFLWRGLSNLIYCMMENVVHFIKKQFSVLCHVIFCVWVVKLGQLFKLMGKCCPQRIPKQKFYWPESFTTIVIEGGVRVCADAVLRNFLF